MKPFAISLLLLLLTACSQILETDSKPTPAAEPAVSNVTHAPLPIPMSYKTVDSSLKGDATALDTEFYPAHISVSVKDEGLLFTIPSYTLFNLNNKIKPTVKIYLDKIIAIGIQPQYKTIIIFGFTDSQGKLADHIKLSKKWATSVEKYLVENGLRNKKIIVEGRGSFFPIDSNFTTFGKMQNRRVEILIK